MDEIEITAQERREAGYIVPSSSEEESSEEEYEVDNEGELENNIDRKFCKNES